MAEIQVALENGSLVMCKVVERLGYNNDIGARATWVSHEGKEFMAVNKLGAWRKWGAADRARPIIEWTEREARLRADEQDGNDNG